MGDKASSGRIAGRLFLELVRASASAVKVGVDGQCRLQALQGLGRALLAHEYQRHARQGAEMASAKPGSRATSRSNAARAVRPSPRFMAATPRA